MFVLIWSKKEKTEKEKYLGDQIASNCTNKINIMERKNKGVGLISEIMTLLDDICNGGKYYFKKINW